MHLTRSTEGTCTIGFRQDEQQDKKEGAVEEVSEQQTADGPEM